MMIGNTFAFIEIDRLFTFCERSAMSDEVVNRSLPHTAQAVVCNLHHTLAIFARDSTRPRPCLLFVAKTVAAPMDEQKNHGNEANNHTACEMGLLINTPS